MTADKMLKAIKLPKLYWRFYRQWTLFRLEEKSSADSRFPVTRWSDRIPALWENTATTSFDAHYVYHTAWAIRMVLQNKPAKHVDISSSLYFCSALSASLPVEFYDYRPAGLTLSGLTGGAADLTDLQFADGSLESLSCMHTIEHIGLGRYGDEIDPQGDYKAARELSRVVRPGGHLLMVVPVGQKRICFNAHRIYDTDTLLAMFSEFDLIAKSLVKDDGSYHVEPSLALFDEQSYGCGCFLLRKKEP